MVTAIASGDVQIGNLGSSPLAAAASRNLPIVAFIVIQMRGLDVSDAVLAAGPGMASLSGGATGMAAFLLVFANLNWAFTFYGGQPQLTSRVMAMRDLKEYRYTRNIALAWIAAAYTGAFCIGILGLPLYGANAFNDAEILLPHMIQDLFHPAIAGILIASIMAAMMSTEVDRARTSFQSPRRGSTSV